MKKNHWIIAGVVLALAIIYGSTQRTVSSPVKATHFQTIEAPENSAPGYLNDLVNFAHESYLADRISKDGGANDTAATMATLMQMIDHEKQAVSFMTKYASSTNKTISSTASLLAYSQIDVIVKQQQTLDQMRSLSNGESPSDTQYVIAQLIAAQNKRTDNMTLVFGLIPTLTMDLSSIEGSSTAKVGSVDPSGLMTPAEKSSTMTALRLAFGDTLDSNENDVFLLLAQEINLMLTSPTYSDFHDNWIRKVNAM